MTNSAEHSELIKNFITLCEAQTVAVKALRASPEYKAWEQALASDVAKIRESAKDFDPEKIIITEISCIKNDLAFHKKNENEYGLRFAKHNMFQCVCAFNFLQEIKKSPKEYKEMAKLCEFDDDIRIPRFDSFLSACINVYKRLDAVYKAGTGDYWTYYKARVENLRIAIRGYRRWQKKVLRGN